MICPVCGELVTNLSAHLIDDHGVLYHRIRDPGWSGWLSPCGVIFDSHDAWIRHIVGHGKACPVEHFLIRRDT